MTTNTMGTTKPHSCSTAYKSGDAKILSAGRTISWISARKTSVSFVLNRSDETHDHIVLPTSVDSHDSLELTSFDKSDNSERADSLMWLIVLIGLNEQ